MNGDDLIGSSEVEVFFPCPRCSADLDEYVENATFDYTADYASDGVATACTNIDCHRCGLELTVEVVARPHEKLACLPDYPDTKVDLLELPFDDHWEKFLADYFPTDPYEVYASAISEVEALKFELQAFGSKVPLYYKMLYTHYITIMEAYLSDRLIKLVLDDAEKRTALVGRYDALRKNEVTLIDLAKDPTILERRVKAYLQRLSFHDLELVEILYDAVLKVEIFASKEVRTEALNAVQDRHHLVHRNGRNNEGQHVEVDEERVEVIERLVKQIVNRVEGGYRSYMHERELSKALQDLKDEQ